MKLALCRALYDRVIRWEGCSSLSSPPSPNSKPISSACVPCPRGHGHRPYQGEIARQAAQTLVQTPAGTLPHACHGRVFHQRSRRAFLRLKTNRISHTQPAPVPLTYDFALFPESTHISASILFVTLAPAAVGPLCPSDRHGHRACGKIQWPGPRSHGFRALQPASTDSAAHGDAVTNERCRPATRRPMANVI